MQINDQKIKHNPTACNSKGCVCLSYKSLHAGNLTNEEKNSIYNGKTTMVFAKILKVTNI